jgi:outer membrane protein TolC
MSLRPLRAVWLCAALNGLAPPAFALAPQAGSPLSLDEARQLAEARAPQISASRAQADAARNMAVAAGQLPDPVLKLGVNNLPISGEAGWSVTREGMTMRSVGLMQELTRSAKREARSARALREADMAQANEDLARLAVRRDAALAWLDVAWFDSMREQLERQLGELTLQQQAAESAFRAGRDTQAALVASQLAIGRSQDQLSAMQRDVAMARARLSRFIGADAERAVIAPEGSAAPTGWQLERALAALDQHPSQTLANRRIAFADADAGVARENRTPDVAVELMYSQRGPGFANMVSLNLSMPLPWDRAHRQDRELGASLARVNQAEAEREDAAREYRAALIEAQAAWQANRQRLARYDESLVPLAGQQVEAALAAYRAGTAPLASVLEARRMLIDTRMERQRAGLDVARSRVQLEFLDPLATPVQGEKP